MSKDIQSQIRFENCVSTGEARLMIRQSVGVKMSRQTLVRLLEEGRILAFKFHEAGRWNVDHSSLLSYIRSIRETPPN